MKILVRGDCTSRRFVMLNRAKFSKTITLVTNEKAPNAVFVDHLNGIVARPELLSRYIDESRMGKSQLGYFHRQFERNVLAEKGACLLVIDPYSEMNFQLWRHREERWRFWAPRASVINMREMQETFESCGYQTIESSVEETKTVISAIRVNNPGVPILFLPQLLDYYKALQERRHFNELGSLLSQEGVDLFVGRTLSRAALVPADLGTGGGPDQTLHFSGDTYWASAKPALDAGLLESVGQIDSRIGKTIVTTTLLNAEPISVSLQENSNSCVDACQKLVDTVKTNLQEYFSVNDPTFNRTKEVRYRAAVIDLEKYRDYAEYEAFVKKSGKGARIRQRNKAARLGFIVDRFHWRLHIPDIHEINTSTDARSGGPMRGTYLKSVEEMGGAPTRPFRVDKPTCPRHWAQPWGVFQLINGYKQGNQTTNRKLVGYIYLRRFGEFLLYSLILGHHDFLPSGVMILLHHEVMKWTLDADAPEAAGLKAVMYAGYDQGTQGLRDWKSREAFEPFLMQVTN